MSIFARYQDRFEAAQEEEMSVQDYLELCKRDATAYASVAERMLLAIGESELIDTPAPTPACRASSRTR